MQDHKNPLREKSFMKRIRLPRRVRTFLPAGIYPNLLYWTKGYIEEGTEVVLGEPCTKTYGHGSQLVVPIHHNEQNFFVIAAELGSPDAVLAR